MPYISHASTAGTTSPTKCRLSPSATETSPSKAMTSPVSSSGSPRHARHSKTCVNGPVNCGSSSKCNGGMSPCTYTLQHTDGLKVVFKSSPIHPSQRHSPSRYSGGEEVTLEGSSRRLDSSSPYGGGAKRDRANRLSDDDDTNKRLRLSDDDELSDADMPFKSYSNSKNGVNAMTYDTESCVVDSEADTAVAGLLSSTDECTDDNLQTDACANTISGTGAYNWDMTGEGKDGGQVAPPSYGESNSENEAPTWTDSGGELNMALGGLLSESSPQLGDGDELTPAIRSEGGESLGSLQNEMESAINSIISLGQCNIPGAALAAGSSAGQFVGEQQTQDDLEMAIQSILT